MKLPTHAEGLARQRAAFARALAGDDDVIDGAAESWPADLAGRVVLFEHVPAVEALRVVTAAGACAVVVFDGPAPEAHALAAEVGGLLVEQAVVEAAVLALRGAPRAATLEAPADEAPRAVLLVAGAAEAAVAAAAATAVPLAPVGAGLLRSLEAANAALRKANAGLAREHLGRADAGGATVVARFDERIVAAEARAEAAEGELVWARRQRDELAERLATETEILMEADRRYRVLEQQLRSPRYRAADRARDVVVRVPGARAAAGAGWRALTRPPHDPPPG